MAWLDHAQLVGLLWPDEPTFQHLACLRTLGFELLNDRQLVVFFPERALRFARGSRGLSKQGLGKVELHGCRFKAVVKVTSESHYDVLVRRLCLVVVATLGALS